MTHKPHSRPGKPHRNDKQSFNEAENLSFFLFFYFFFIFSENNSAVSARPAPGPMYKSSLISTV